MYKKNFLEGNSRISNVTEFLNTYKNGTNTSMWSGIISTNNDNLVEQMSYM
jgi:hypothetical protein